MYASLRHARPGLASSFSDVECMRRAKCTKMPADISHVMPTSRQASDSRGLSLES